jgi:hypothetical protein
LRGSKGKSRKNNLKTKKDIMKGFTHIIFALGSKSQIGKRGKEVIYIISENTKIYSKMIGKEINS